MRTLISRTGRSSTFCSERGAPLQMHERPWRRRSTGTEYIGCEDHLRNDTCTAVDPNMHANSIKRTWLAVGCPGGIYELNIEVFQTQ